MGHSCRIFLITVIVVSFWIADPLAGWNSSFLHNYHLLTLVAVILIILGGLSFPLQSICVAHAFERRPECSIALSTYLLFIWAAGSVAGPTFISLLSPVLENRAPDVVVIALSGSLALFCAYRLYAVRLFVIRRSSIHLYPTANDMPYTNYHQAQVTDK